jgi:hypothetical protein
MEEVKFNINIHDLAAKFINVRRDQKINIVFNLLNLKNRGIINNTPLIKFAALLEIDLQLLKDKISAVKDDDDIFPIMAKYKMMVKYDMISSYNLAILAEHANYKLEHIYKNMDLASQKRIIYKNISDIQLN